MQPEARLTHYEMISAIGKGGMGEVWKARDIKLGRSVAIKILPRDFEQKEDWLARFEREAKVLASLNHPNIAAIHGFDRDQGVHFLVLELVGGETLADLLKRSPMALEESLKIARQIAAGLEAAHENGVIHRDLKPANIKITEDGTVKILDFGLARPLWAGDTITSGESPTLSVDTREGLILGTAAYMAPEQARGKRVDKRADIWSFGVVLYEMVSGVRLFEGSDLTETLASVVMRDPDFKLVPHRIRRLLRKCLEKDPKNRLRDIADAWELLDDGQVDADAPSAVTRKWKSRLPWIVACLLGVAVLVLSFLWMRPSPLPGVVRFEIHAPRGAILPLGTPAISPDGNTLAYVVQDADGTSRIHVRPIDLVETRVLPGTEGGVHPFWSPDGRSLAFVSSNSLKRIELAGGTPRHVMNVGGPWHGAWNQFGDILGIAFSTIVHVSDQGGTPTPIEGGNRDTFPAFLSDGKRFLVRLIDEKGSSIQLATLGSDKRSSVLDNILSAPILAATPKGKMYLLYLRDSDLMAREFDESSGKVVGNSTVLIRRIGRLANPAVMPAVGVSRKGILAYQSADTAEVGQLTWVGRSGRPVETLSADVSVQDPMLSPDGFFVVGERSSGGRDVWVTDLRRKSSARITLEDSLDSSGIWSNDGKRIAFSRAGKGILAVDARGGGTPELLTPNAGNPTSWSPDGRYLLYTYQTKAILLELTGTKNSVSLGSANASSSNARFSPDGKAIVFASNETGRSEVFIQATPPQTGRIQVSLKGGNQPRWSHNGKEIYFISSDGFMTVAEVTLGEIYSVGAIRELFKYTGKGGFDMTKDGSRFLILSAPKEVDSPITVVMNWWADLDRH